jgi:hypothetical protein
MLCIMFREAEVKQEKRMVWATNTSTGPYIVWWLRQKGEDEQATRRRRKSWEREQTNIWRNKNKWKGNSYAHLPIHQQPHQLLWMCAKMTIERIQHDSIVNVGFFKVCENGVLVHSFFSSIHYTKESPHLKQIMKKPSFQISETVLSKFHPSWATSSH